MLGSHQIAPAPKPAVKAQPGQVTAEWIDYVIQTPGKPAQTIRREIFDLIGPAARAAGGAIPGPQMTDAQKLDRALCLMDTVEMLPVAAPPSPEFILHSSDRNLSSNREAVLKLIGERRSPQSKDFMNEFGKLKAVIPEHLNALAFARFEWGDSQSMVYLGQPNILTYHKRPRVLSTGLLIMEEGFDIVFNDVAVSPNSSEEPFGARLAQGVLDTNAEAALAGPEARAANTANAFALAGGQSAKWLVIKNGNAPASRQVGLSRDAQALLLNDVRRGFSAIAPSVGTPLKGCTNGCWWRINPQSGETLGLGDRGWGQGTVEYLHAAVAGAAGVLAGSIAWVSCRMSASVSKTVCLACSVAAGLGVALFFFFFFEAWTGAEAAPFWAQGARAALTGGTAFGCPLLILSQKIQAQSGLSTH